MKSRTLKAGRLCQTVDARRGGGVYLWTSWHEVDPDSESSLEVVGPNVPLLVIKAVGSCGVKVCVSDGRVGFMHESMMSVI